MTSPGCQCVHAHRPKPMNVAVHHIVPKSWGGPDVASNRVTLCPTAHENVHTLLNAYVHAGGPPPWNVLRRYNAYVRRLALTAWRGRPSNRPPYTIA